MKKLIKRLIILLLIISAVGYYVGNRMAKQHGFSGLSEFISNYFENKSLAEEFTPESVQINMAESDYDFIENKRTEALERGIQINIGDNYVPCEIEWQGSKIEGELRLKGHMTDHLKGDKWSFRVKTKDEFMGMYRFSLQHPGTRGYVKEWIYHELLAQENIINLKYDFIQLKLNEKDLGIYAVEEHFGQHVLTRNNKPKGAIIRWNPELYWEGRIDEYQYKYLDQQYSHYYSTFAEPYDKGKVLKDEELKQNYINGATRLELFRRGELSCSETFDIEKMASFHAIIDLVGGHHSLDWSDVKYYYNSISQKIEPIGYESFSISRTERIAGQQLPEKYNGLENDYHARLFSDPDFYEAYIKALERIASEDYLNSFIKIIKPKLNEKLGFLAHEFAYIPFSWDPYFENIELIRHNLNLPKAAHPFLKDFSDSTITLTIGAVSDFPLEVVSISVNEKRTFTPKTKTIIQPKERNSFTNYTEVEFENNGKKVKNLVLELRIPGSSNSFFIDVEDYNNFSDYKYQEETSIDTGIISYRGNSVFIEGNYVVPDNHYQTFHGVDSIIISGNISVKGDLRIIGIQDRPIVLTLNKKSNRLINKGNLFCENVRFYNSPTIYNENGSATFHQCEVSSTEEFIYGHGAEIIISSCFVQNVENFVQLINCKTEFNEVHCSSGHLFMNMIAGTATIRNSSFQNYNQFGKINFGASLRAWNVDFVGCESTLSLSNKSTLSLNRGRIENTDLAFNIDSDNIFPFESEYTYYQTQFIGVNEMENKK